MRKLKERAGEARRDLEKLERAVAGHEEALKTDRPAGGFHALAIRLAESDPDGLRYFRGGWYSVPAVLGAQESPAVGGAAVRELVVSSCVEAGWLERHGVEATDLKGGMAALYAARWTATDKGRAAARAART